MILGKIETLINYKSVNKNIETICNFLKYKNLIDIPTGRYELDKNIYFNIDEYISKDISKGIIENHQRYFDLQIILTEEEMVGYKDLTGVSSINYSIENDIEFFDKADFFIPFYKNYFMIFFTQDGHAPCLHLNKNACMVKKVVFKIPVLTS